MNLDKKRNKVLWIVVLVSFLIFLLALWVNCFDDDEYIVSWLFAMSQALFVFAVFRFKVIKELQKKSKTVWRATAAVLIIGAMVTLIGFLLSRFSLYTYSKEISHIGSFIAGLGINGLVSYTSNYFDFVEEVENKQQVQE